MRALEASRTGPVLASNSQSLRSGWMQAGFSSFAYRLAHLRAPRLAVVSVLSVVFLLA